MKKYFFLAVALLFWSISAGAQLIGGAGYIYSSEKTVGLDGKHPFHGFYVGASYNISIAAGLGVAPGLYGTVLIHNDNAAAGSIKIGYNVLGSDREISLKLPVNLTYSLDFGQDRGLIAYAGPVFQLGVTNSTSVSGSVTFLGLTYGNGDSVNNYDAKKGTMNRFNIYLGGGVGLQLGDMIFHVGYDHSLMDVDKDSNYITSRGQLIVGLALAF